MNPHGTIDHPSTRDPQLRHLPKQDPPMNTSSRYTTDRPEAGSPHFAQNRNRQMQLMPESLARIQMESRLYEAESERTALRVRRARRLQRRAERASLRARQLQRRAERASLQARRAVAMAVMQ